PAPTRNASSVGSPGERPVADVPQPPSPAGTDGSANDTQPAPASDRGSRAVAVAAGTRCARAAKQVRRVADAPTFQPDGEVWSRVERWGCGCPHGPEFTMLFEPGTSPLRVRLCHDEGQDPCEAGCRETLRWDLAQPLRAAGAKDVVFVDP